MTAPLETKKKKPKQKTNKPPQTPTFYYPLLKPSFLGGHSSYHSRTSTEQKQGAEQGEHDHDTSQEDGRGAEAYFTKDKFSLY